MSELTYKWIQNKDYTDCFKVREEVFVKEQKISREEEYDGIDDKCQHIVAYINSEPIATGRIVTKDNKHYLGRIAVIKKYRGEGYATGLIKEMISYLKQQNVNEIYLSSQLYVKELYEKIGFKEFGDIYLDCNIEHVSMIYKG